METAKLLERVGDRNRFQIYSIVFVCFKWMIVSLTVFLPSYLFVTPTFTCGTVEKVLEADACPMISNCVIQQPLTITAHAQLYCDDKYLRDSIISSQFIGSIIGLIVLSILADNLGRKIIIVTTLFLTAIGSSLLTIGAHFTIYFFMYLGLIMMGFGGYALSMVSYSYLSEINNDLWRQKSLIMTYSFWAIGQIMLFPLIRFIQDWQYVCLTAFIIPLVILLIMSYFIVQTPQFCWVNKRYDECLENLNLIAKFNGVKQLPSLGVLPTVEQQKQPQKITDTFTKKKYLIPLIILSLAQVCNNCIYYTTQYSITELGQSFQFNMLLIGCLQLVSCLITNFYCQKMYRKRWLIIFMVTSGIIGLLIQFTIDNSIFQMILIGFSRLLNTFSFALFSLLTTESFPTSIRSTGTGISQAMSNVGNMIAPFLVTISGQLKVKSVLLGGFVCIFGGLSLFFVAQTKQQKKQSDNPLLANISAQEQQIVQNQDQDNKSNHSSQQSKQNENS